jgi:nucleotide-binding universal stress UspA family protein
MTARIILVAIDASPQSLAALDTAAEVATRLNAELRGMYVEDINLIRAAELPFARAITSSGQSLPLTPETVQRQLNRYADVARNAVEAAGLRCNLSWSFSVVRGTVPSEIVQAASVADFVTVGRSGWSAESAATQPLGSVTRSLVEAGTTSLLMVGERGLRGPLAVIYDGSPSSDRAVALAEALNGDGPWPITAISVGIPAMERLKCEKIHSRMEMVQSDPGVLLFSLGRAGARTVLLPVTALDQHRESAAILNQRNLSVFLVK